MLKFHPLKVAEIRIEPEQAIYVALQVPTELQDAYHFEAGQHIGLRAVVDGQEVRRTYSIINSPGEDRLQIAVRLHELGEMSRFLAKHIRAGDALEVLTPNGSFHTPVDSTGRRTYAAFASGSGITPVVSIVRTLLMREPAGRMLLFYGNRNMARVMLLEELQALKDRYLDRLALYFLFSREPQDVQLLNGRLDGAKLRELANSVFDAARVDEFFLCGPGDMNDQLATELGALGVPSDRVHAERFSIASTSGAAATVKAAPAVLQVKPGGTQVAIIMDGRRRAFSMAAEGETVLEAAERAGLDLPFSCRAGVCSTCRTKVLKGAVEMAQNYALEPWEVEAGFILACQSHPTTAELEISYDER